MIREPEVTEVGMPWSRKRGNKKQDNKKKGESKQQGSRFSRFRGSVLSGARSVGRGLSTVGGGIVAGGRTIGGGIVAGGRAVNKVAGDANAYGKRMLADRKERLKKEKERREKESQRPSPVQLRL
tara:strand:+ start:1205 stop:1579 length:375 start_codon:yes stop_codon:yes gene_type:complete